MKKLRIGVVGCGHISKKHFDAIGENSTSFELVAACDRSEKIRESMVDEYGVKVFSDMEVMLQESNLDIVSLCTPSGLHPEQAKLAAKYNVNVLSEKPMALSSSDAKEMIDAFAGKSVSLYPVKQIRYNPYLQYLKNEILNKDRFGQIYHVNLNVYWTRPQDYFDVAPWRGTIAMDGGMLLNQMVHFVDLFEWLFGPVKTATGIAKTAARNIETEDVVVSNIEWESGVIGSFNATILTYPKNLETSITILGEKGTFRLAGGALNNIVEASFEDPPPAYLAPEGALSWHGQLYGHVSSAILEGEASTITSASALRDIEIIEAIYSK